MSNHFILIIAITKSNSEFTQIAAFTIIQYEPWSTFPQNSCFNQINIHEQQLSILAKLMYEGCLQNKVLNEFSQ
jgi:hypothetical protein